MSSAQEQNIVLFTHSCEQKHQLKALNYWQSTVIFHPKPKLTFRFQSRSPRGGGGVGERRDQGVNCPISARFTFVAYFLLVPHRAVGVSDQGVIPDSAFASSSEHIPLNYSAARALTKEDDEGEWCAHYNDTQQWLQANLSYTSEQNDQGLVRLQILRAFSEESWVISFRVSKSDEGSQWESEVKRPSVRSNAYQDL